MTWHLCRLPFFEKVHYDLAEKLEQWRTENCDLFDLHPDGNYRPIYRKVLGRLATAGLLDHLLPQTKGEVIPRPDVRSLCIIREALAFDSFLVDAIFIMQGLGTAPLWHHRDRALRERVLSACRAGTQIAAIACTEPSGGSDLAQVATTAALDGSNYVLNGEKAWITSAGVADHYIVVARTGEGPGARGLSVFLVPATVAGLEVDADVPMIAPHSIGSLRFINCRVPASNLIGAAGSGFKAAMRTFDIFRPTVGAAAVGGARRALQETLERAKTRQMFGRKMSELDAVQARVADMVTDTEIAALTVYRAAWMSDVIGGRISRDAAMAKLVATEAASRVIDSAVQLFGALGVARGSVIERLYREIRPLRIYEGASEVQRMIIGRSVLAGLDE